MQDNSPYLLKKIIKVLIVDDSAYIRKVIKEILSKSPFIEIVGTAINGKDALEKVEALNPDVITLDLIMPEMDGLSFLIEQMKRKPIPTVVCSIASETGDLALKALEIGAIDFVQKPTALATEKVYEIADELVEKIKAASNVSLVDVKNIIETPIDKKIEVDKTSIKSNYDIICIGVSTGGPQALKTLIPLLPKNFPVPIAVVLHMPVGYTELYAQRLDQISEVTVVEAKEDEELLPGKVIIAQSGKHLTFKKTLDNKVVAHLDIKPFDSLFRPSVDVLFKSAANLFGKRTLGIILTGMGQDGKDGAAAIKFNNGTIITEDEKTCIVYGMPRAVVEAGLSDRSVPLYEILNTIKELI